MHSGAPRPLEGIRPWLMNLTDATRGASGYLTKGTLLRLLTQKCRNSNMNCLNRQEFRIVHVSRKPVKTGLGDPPNLAEPPVFMGDMREIGKNSAGSGFVADQDVRPVAIILAPV